MTARSGDGFVAFFRRYTRTWVHALATAALTLFGTLTFLHPGFAAVAVAGYVLPPVALYVTGTSPESVARGVATDGAVDDSTDASPATGWRTVDVPTDAALLDAAPTRAGTCAVGAGGVVLAGDGEGWDVALRDGPGASRRDLRGVDAVGDVVWVAGDGGALGRLDLASGRHTDHSAPADRTDSWTDVAVAGAPGDATLLLANGSGEVLRGRYRDGDLVWEAPTKPGSGSSLAAVSLVDARVGYLCDTNDAVFETTDGGESYDAVGVDGASGTPTDVAATARGAAAVAVDDGTVRTYADGNWTPARPAEAPLTALSLRDGRALACGRDGAVYERPGPGADWERTAVAGSGLHGVALGPTRAVAVGADGTVAERRSPLGPATDGP